MVLDSLRTTRDLVLCVEQDALAEEFEARATEHLTLEHLDPVDVAFDDAGVPGL